MKLNRWMSFIALLAILTLAFTGSSVIITDFEAQLAENNNNRIALTWKAEHDGNIQRYEIHRKMQHESQFQHIGDKPTSPSTASVIEYEFEDDSVFRNQAQGDQVIYQLKNGSQVLAETDINYTSSGVRRTWGSIKRMFQ